MRLVRFIASLLWFATLRGRRFSKATTSHTVRISGAPSKNSAADYVKQIVKDTGYNDSPFFGAEKKKVRIIGELVTVNAALAIYAVNQVFELNDAKEIIDTFLATMRKPVFGFLEEKDPAFKERYEQRMAEYFKVLSEDKPSLGLSFCFMRNIDLDPSRICKDSFLWLRVYPIH